MTPGTNRPTSRAFKPLGRLKSRTFTLRHSILGGFNMATSSDNRALPLAAVNIAALVLASIVTALRCFVRVRLLKAFGADDWLMLAAAVCLSNGTHISHRANC